MSRRETSALSTRDENQTRERVEKDITTEVKELIEEHEGTVLYADFFVDSLIGIDTPQADELREQAIEGTKNIKEASMPAPFLSPEEALAIEKSSAYSRVLHSLTGIDSDYAWEVRESLWDMTMQEQKDDVKGAERTVWVVDIAESLAGIDSEKAESMRKKFKKADIDRLYQLKLISYAGVDSRDAWKEREKAFKKGLEGDNMALEALLDSLVGVQTEQAEQMRQAINEKVALAKSASLIDEYKLGEDSELERHTKKRAVGKLLESIIGIDSDSAWEVREEALQFKEARSLLGRPLFEFVLKSLANLNSERAWEIREKFLEQLERVFAVGVSQREEGDALFRGLALSVVGIYTDRAENFRKELNRLAEEKKFMFAVSPSLKSYSGDYKTYVAVNR